MGGAAASDADLGAAIHALASELFPICRSLAGPGLRDTLDVLDRFVPIARTEVPTGTRLFDWQAPSEWQISGASIEDMEGRTILDFAEGNLHVVNRSVAVDRVMTLEELRPHIHTLPEQPDLTPYRTAYHVETWGFCMPHRRFAAMRDTRYRVRIDARIFPGALTFGEHVHPGSGKREILLSAHACHPSLANDNCSGLAVLAFVAAALSERRTRHAYRFLFAPATLGALAWLAANEGGLGRLAAGLTVSCVGDGGGPIYKRSRRGDGPGDRAMALVLRGRGPGAAVIGFSPYGYDERQFCSPGFNLPVGLFQRSAFGTFPEYHTSADDLAFIRPEHLAASFDMIMEWIEILEGDWIPVNLFPKGEPQLGRRGLFSRTGGHKVTADATMALLWVLNLGDGVHSLIDVADRSGLPFATIARAAEQLLECGLVTRRDAALPVRGRRRRRRAAARSGPSPT